MDPSRARQKAQKDRRIWMIYNKERDPASCIALVYPTMLLDYAEPSIKA